MVKVNLLPKEDLEKKAIGKFLKWTLSYGRYIIICVEMVVFCVFFSRFIYDQKLADINERVEQKQAIVASASDFESRIRNIQKNIEQVKDLDNGRTIYLALLSRLEQIIPKDMVLTSLQIKEDTVEIEGETPTNESFARFITDLKASNTLLSSIAINTVGKNKIDLLKDESDQNTNVQFSLTAKIEGYHKYEPTPSDQPAQPAGTSGTEELQ